MFGCYGGERKCLRTAGVFLVLGVLTSCSYVPDAMNPVEWYRGAEDLITGHDRPQVASPRPAKDQGDAAAAKPVETAATPQKEPAKGLVADRGNSKYAQPVRREVAPTKPLARRTPAPAATQTAAAPAPAAAPPAAPAAAAAAPAAAAQPVQVAQDTPRLDPERRQPTARDTGPAAPPASVDMQPPGRPDIPETVPVPGQKLKPVQQHYQKRLAESAAIVVRPDVVDIPGQARISGAEEPIHLIPPTKTRGRGGKGLAAPAPQPAGPAATFQVAALDFQPDSSKLTRADLASIAEVARLYRQTGGVVRVVGIAPAPGFAGGDAVAQAMGGYDASMQRAAAVAKELTRRGVPARKIMVGADPNPGIGGVGAKVYLDVI